MIQVNSKFALTVKFVKHRETAKGFITSFSIGDKIKDAPQTQYQNYNFAVYDNIRLQDGDRVVIKSIDSVSANYYNGKVYYNLVGTVALFEPEPQQAEDYQGYVPAPSPAPTQQYVPASEDETSLPFDI